MFKKNLKILVITLLLSLIFTGCSTKQTEKADEVSSDEPVSLLVYSGAGLKKAMEDIKPAFEAKENVKIEYVYAGSGQLISQIETTGKGDVLIVGSEGTYNIAKEKGFASEYQLIAHHTPTIAVEKGNPKNITSLEDLEKEGLKVAIGDAKANAVGKTAAKIIEKNGLIGIEKNVVTKTATVNELVVVISTGQADAAIVTEDSIRNNDKVDMIDIEKDKNIDQLIPVGTLESSKNQELAQKLVDFIASEEGKAIFEKKGYRIVEQ